MIRLLLALMWCVLFAADAGAQQSVQREEAAFVVSSRGQVFYAMGCDGAKRLSPANLRYFRTAGDAEAAGYRPSRARGCAPQLDTALIEPTINGRATCVVSRIIDGDTFQCEGGSRVRLLLVDTDEIGQSVYSDSAALLVQQLIPPGTSVRLEFDVGLYDRYQRLLAHAYADEVSVNRELVRRGLARVSVYQPNVARLELVRAAADSARMERLGVWSGNAFACTPAEYRAGKCR